MILRDKELRYSLDWFWKIKSWMKSLSSPQVPWWNKRTRMERRFLVFAGALTVVAIAMGAGLILLARDKVM